MKYRDSGFEHELQNSGLTLGWIQRRVDIYNFKEVTVYLLRNALIYAIQMLQENKEGNTNIIFKSILEWWNIKPEGKKEEIFK